jgi:melibiase-like protein
VAALAGAALVLAAAPAQADTVYRDGSVYARVGDSSIELGNGLTVRRWTRTPFRTAELTDRRVPARLWSGGSPDFALTFGALELRSDAFTVNSASVANLARGGLRVTIHLTLAAVPPGLPAGLEVTRIAEAYPGVAGFRTQTVIVSPAPLGLTRARLDELVPVGPVTPTVHSFRAGADWREPGWAGPPVTIGDPHPGTWRESHSAGPGVPLEGLGEWLSLADVDRTAFMVTERNDLPSSRELYDGLVASPVLDFSHDILSLGPFEEQIHLENPGPGPGRVRVVRPGEPFALPAVFVGFGRNESDEPWQFHKYLTDHRLLPYQHAVTFNSNGIDENRISTGAKDDMDFATVQQLAPIARRMGVETFILDDGWQARSGDWQPDSPEYPEPRWDGSPDSKFKPRFPDPEFRAVRDAIAPMNLGLWMSPTFFNPSSETFAQHPEWECRPIGDALVADNRADPEGGSNEAGLGPWGPAALPHVEGRIREAISSWRVRYFKFDFLVWLDCLEGPDGARDLYEFHDAFVAMLDRLRADYPEVTFEIDETNDYRLFPFESVTRGPTWFQNGGPAVDHMLHNLWNLSPFVPTFALGQNALANEDFAHYPVDTLMAAALLSHITFFGDPRRLPDAVVDRVGAWTSFYKRYRDRLGGVVYPLLADPLQRGWTALQAWDPEHGTGALLAFRQGSSEGERRIALANVPSGRRFELRAAPDDRRLGTVTSEGLRTGLDVRIPESEGARVILIKPSS